MQKTEKELALSAKKNRTNINHYGYKKWKSFRAPKYPFLTEAMMIDRLLSFSTPLKEAYPVFHINKEPFLSKTTKKHNRICCVSRTPAVGLEPTTS